MTPEDLSAIEARVKAATEGPWTDVDVCWCGDIHLNGAPRPQDHDYPPSATDADRALMGAARSDIPALVEEVRRLRGLFERIRPHFRSRQGAHGSECRDWENLDCLEAIEAAMTEALGE